MDWYSLAVFFHLLLFVFWLGTDLGVFLAARISERGELSVETRGTVLGLGMVLDRLPSGVELAAISGQLATPLTVRLALWAGALVWLGILWSGFLNPQTKTEERAMLFNFVMNAILALLVSGTGMYLLYLGEAAAWLSLKITLVGLIFVCGVLLDAMFKPAVEAFVAITTTGATDELNTRYSKAIGPVYVVVLVIYALVLIAAWLGVSKAPV